MTPSTRPLPSTPPPAQARRPSLSGSARRALATGLWAALVLGATSHADSAARIRLTELAKDEVQLEVQLDEPATVELEFGQELFNWSDRVESLQVAELHELRLTKLVPDRQYFYRLLIDGSPEDEVLTFRSGRSWIDRKASLRVSADFGGDQPAERLRAEGLFASAAEVLLFLGGDGGHPEDFAELHGRSLADRLALSVGGPGAADALQVNSYSDVAIVTLGGALPVADDGSLRSEASWLSASLGTVEGACWNVVASAALVEPETPAAEALVRWASGAGVQVLLTRGRLGLSPFPGGLWLRLSEPEGTGASERHFARLDFAAGKLSATLEALNGAPLDAAELRRECPLPTSVATETVFADADPFGEGGSSDLDGFAEECDY